jgi:hypothetical protein
VRDRGRMMSEDFSCGVCRGEKVTHDDLENKSTISDEEGRQSGWGSHQGLCHSLSLCTVYVHVVGTNAGGKDVQSGIVTEGRGREGDW